MPGEIRARDSMKLGKSLYSFSRRELLKRSGTGIGMLALASSLRSFGRNRLGRRGG